MRDVTRFRDSSGFSLVEVMIAALILVVGAGAAFSLINSANRSVTFNSARVGATNLGRELAEYARNTDYDLLQPSQVVDALRKRTRIAGTLSGSMWKIERRGVTYTVSASVCTFDDPKDGLGTTAPDNACPIPAAVAGAPAEINPDDFRRVTYTLNWKVRGRAGTTSHSTLVVNPAGGLGPRIETFNQPAAQITGSSIAWGATSPLGLKLKSSPAASVRWAVDVSGGDAGGGSKEWGFTWDFGTAFSTSTPWVRDGTYTVSAQGFDSRGVPGEAKIVAVHVNRHVPNPVTGLHAGYNSARKVVDMRWDRYDERDLQGYRVYRVSDGAQVCPAGGGVQSGLSCTTGVNPPDSAYKVVAVDCTDLMAVACALRNGTASVSPLITNAGGGTAPDAPTGLTASVVDGKPTLTWTAPATVPQGPIRFYRIYRDTGTGVGDRYDETVTNSPNYVDPNPGSTTAHRYWVSAIDHNFNESPVSAPVLAPPLP
jgi:prepilin-type N-terminal cleavage/methylation domain-containing protein